jgi:ribosome-associated heat shock protein Hsp15
MVERSESKDTIRIDKWLWQARFFKTRTLAQTRATAGHIRLNGRKVQKQGTSIRAGDVMTLASRGRVVVLRVLALGERRGPATEAQTLYEIIKDA